MSESKVCSRCGEEKSIEAFAKRNDAGGYRRRQCKSCYYGRVNARRRSPAGREKRKLEMRGLRATNPEHHRQLSIDSKRKLRCQAIEKLGNKCVYCGCDIFEALEINHVNGDGRQAWLETGTSPMHRQIRDGEYPHEVELTCRVCNSVHYLKLKGIEGFTVTFERIV